MNKRQIIVAIASLFFVSGSFAAENVDTAAAKKAAVEACTAGATEKYGSAQAISKPRKKSVGRTRGYGVKMRVGKKKKTINCIASSDGAVSFFSGSF
ncbi:MAG: hypothetical protein GXP15_15445 [Gammaproteobacteria bacterium]|nr:hypothetical protein [Gammaproteobacteria bacterium]